LIRPAERSPEDYDGTVPFVILRLYLCKYLVEMADDDPDAAYEAAFARALGSGDTGHGD